MLIMRSIRILLGIITIVALSIAIGYTISALNFSVLPVTGWIDILTIVLYFAVWLLVTYIGSYLSACKERTSGGVVGMITGLIASIIIASFLVFIIMAIPMNDDFTSYAAIYDLLFILIPVAILVSAGIGFLAGRKSQRDYASERHNHTP